MSTFIAQLRPKIAFLSEAFVILGKNEHFVLLMDKKVSNSGPYDSVQNWIKNKTFQVQVWKMPQGQIHFLLLSKDVLKSENQFLSIFFRLFPASYRITILH